jgi:hypothetical protein
MSRFEHELNHHRLEAGGFGGRAESPTEEGQGRRPRWKPRRSRRPERSSPQGKPSRSLRTGSGRLKARDFRSQNSDIKGDLVAGIFGTYDDALAAAYRNFGIGGFLVKKIERVESVLHFTRDIR